MSLVPLVLLLVVIIILFLTFPLILAFGFLITSIGLVIKGVLLNDVNSVLIGAILLITSLIIFKIYLR